MDRGKEREPVHPAVLKARVIRRAIDATIDQALNNNPGLAEETAMELVRKAQWVQLCIYFLGGPLAKEALADFLYSINSLSENRNNR